MNSLVFFTILYIIIDIKEINQFKSKNFVIFVCKRNLFKIIKSKNNNFQKINI